MTAQDPIPRAALVALAAELRVQNTPVVGPHADYRQGLLDAAARIEALCGAEPRDAAQSAREAVPHSVLGLGEEREWTCIACGEWVPDPAKSCAQCGS